MYSIIGVIVCLELLVAVHMGSAMSMARAKSCEFPHKGDGGVLDQNQNYINDAALVWVDVAENCFHYVTDPRGNDALNDWIDASYKFDKAMRSGDEEESFRMIDKANDSFKIVAPFIRKSDLSKYFMKVYEEFGALLATRNFQVINEYMIAAYPQFKEKLGC
ncbi:uncharacterized protein LOC119076159 [Bradysia coprophila]|uniref:uncharacterized protein LOC119076159 n=1 Tax=Bradysia coprophila TaxID=38358 RepID=UPI00187D6EBB|nr:uncharacterized protein LOC119076159 [Bradysia coprophila]